ncbi:TadE/TadG family type IV pilus assembly protein [Photobacterium proteolyticum]|nr:VWA domain-containing protein [Photobacterium proteolyticum]
MIIFVGFLPFMVMIMAFSVQLSQQMLAKARLIEAAEVASLALVADTQGTADDHNELAANIIDRYINDNKGTISITMTDMECSDNNGCLDKRDETEPFREMMVRAKARYDAWMFYENVNIEPEFELNSQSVSRRYLPRPVDIYFIVDFSSSMGDMWQSGETKTKLSVVKTTLKKVIEDLKDFNRYNTDRSRVALIGYHQYNVRNINGQRIIYDMDIYKSITKTVNEMFNEKPKADDFFQGNDPYAPRTFNDVQLTDDYDYFISEVESSIASGRFRAVTHSWQGMLRAAVVSDQATNLNPVQVFIVLSDGKDNIREFYDGQTMYKSDNFLKKLAKNGLCDKLFENMKRKLSRHGGNISVVGGVIGIDFSLDKNTNGFYQCMGENNIYHASQGEHVYKYILQLLNEETGRLM